MSVLENWDHWKNFLGDRLNHAQDKGLKDDTINNLAYEIGGYLANEVEAKNEQEEYLLTFGASHQKMSSAQLPT